MNVMALFRPETVADVMSDFENKVQRLEQISIRACETAGANRAVIRDIEAENEKLIQESERANKCAAAIRRLIS